MNILKGLALRKQSASNGFTMVELLVVIAVVGILATVLIAAINPMKQLQKSNDAQRKVALKTIQGALEQYYADNGSYPTTDCWSGSTSCWRLGSGSFLGVQSSNYLKVLPTDPKQTGAACTSTGAYGIFYNGETNGASYALVTRLENTADDQGVTGTIATCHWGGGTPLPLTYILTNQQ